ncbi:MAG: hypothetical protein AABY10_05865 [Nanoarchaeota archaeon]
MKIKEKSNKNKVMKYFGVLKHANIDWDAKEKRMSDFRNVINKRLTWIVRLEKRVKS